MLENKIQNFNLIVCIARFDQILKDFKHTDHELQIVWPTLCACPAWRHLKNATYTIDERKGATKSNCTFSGLSKISPR